MTIQRVNRREQVERDIWQATAYCRSEGGARLETAFVEALAEVSELLYGHPESGSLRYAAIMDFADLRCWSMRRFPYMIFYTARGTVLDVWRILHVQRDVPERFQTPTANPEGSP